MRVGIMEKLTDNDKKMLIDYIESYGFACGEGGAVKASFDHLFRFWEKNKSQYLFDMFGGELILQKEVVYKKCYEDLEDELNRALYGYDSMGTPAYDFAKRFYDFGWDNRFAFTPSMEQAWNSIISSSTLARNVYEGETVAIPTPDGKEIKIAHGCRATRVIGKLAKAFGIDEGFEEFRIAHSVVLNQKELRGNLCLSIHPMDYFTMSDNTCDWSSCMSWQESGCYRMGTVEMMNSPMVIVAYLTASEDMNVPYGTWNSKKWRELYIVHENLITNVKAYPYKNENLTKEVVAWLKELAEAYGLNKYDEVPFFWNYNYQNECERLAHANIRLGLDTNQMYNDFDSDAGQWSYLSEELPTGDRLWINYSGETECMCCGRSDGYYDGEGALVCDTCEEIFWCDDCGDRIYSDDDSYTVDGQTLCYGCYEHHTEECMFTGDVHMRHNCVELNIAWDNDVPAKGRKVRYDRGWGDRGMRDYKPGEKTAILGAKFYIYDDVFDDAIQDYTKSGKYETFERKWDREMLVVRVSDLTEKFAEDAGYESLEGFIAYLKTCQEWEVE